MKINLIQESIIFGKLLALQSEIYQTAQEKGFWEDAQNRNKGETVMLIILELGEAQEAHRKNRSFAPTKHIVAILDGTESSDNPGLSATTVFNVQVKNTYQDEIADAAIRLLDAAAGFGWPLLLRSTNIEIGKNFSEDLLLITSECVFAHYVDSSYWSSVLAKIIRFCTVHDIDLLKHVEWKLQFNKTRPYKHGKEY